MNIYVLVIDLALLRRSRFMCWRCFKSSLFSTWLIVLCTRISMITTRNPASHCVDYLFLLLRILWFPLSEMFFILSFTNFSNVVCSEFRFVDNRQLSSIFQHYCRTYPCLWEGQSCYSVVAEHSYGFRHRPASTRGSFASIVIFEVYLSIILEGFWSKLVV